jgi:hypothetical protein
VLGRIGGPDASPISSGAGSGTLVMCQRLPGSGWHRTGRRLAQSRAIQGASVHAVDAGHGACITAPHSFAPALLQACWSVEAGRGGMLRAPT